MEAIESPFAGVFGGILYGISYAEIVIPLCFAFWATLILVPLRKIYLTDPITALTYLGFCSASAVLVTLAVPMSLTPTTDASTMTSVIITAVAMGIIKWVLSMRQQRKHKSFNPEGLNQNDS